MGQTGTMDGPQNVPAPNVLALPQAPDAIELRHLRAFVAVADDLSFSRAAQRLFISQPALSRQIRGLERLVGCDLFRRSTQRVELTLAGEALLARARALLADLDDAISVTRSVGGELAGRMALLWEPWARASADVADLDGIRAALEELHGQFTPPPDVAVAPVIAGGVPALRVTPEISSPATVLFLHGGGHVAGSAFGYRHLAAAIALAARAPALVIDYRLAPEHPYPAAVDDVWAALRWVAEHASQIGADPARLAVAGDSAGGNLAAVLAQLARDAGGPDLLFQLLWYPGTAQDFTLPSVIENAEGPVLDLASLKTFTTWYAGHIDLANPPVTLAPARAETFAGLPPAFIGVAGHDPLRDDGIRYAAHLTAAGVAVQLNHAETLTHGYAYFAGMIPAVTETVDTGIRALHAALHP